MSDPSPKMIEATNSTDLQQGKAPSSLAGNIGRLDCRLGVAEDHGPTQVMLMALVGKELGHLSADDDLFLGTGLARAASNSQGLVVHHLETLGPGGVLAKAGLVQPCGGELETGGRWSRDANCCMGFKREK